MSGSADLLHELPSHRAAAMYDGLVKVRLAHAQGFSLILPELLFADVGGWAWFQPQFFSACLLNFIDTRASASFTVDLFEGPQFFIDFTKDRLVRHLSDGASIYRCRISGPSGLAQYRMGECAPDPNAAFALRLFHHTAPPTLPLIRTSGHFRGSPWNIQGNKRLTNVEYVYFTSLPRISTDDDLERIAMSSSGPLFLRAADPTLPVIARVDVYRSSTRDRRATLAMWVPCDLIAPPHAYRKDPRVEPVYYEISHPQIYRVGLRLGALAPFAGDQLQVSTANLERFDYVVLGDGNTQDGLLAPYHEDVTNDIFQLERICVEDVFDLWRRYGNRQVFNGPAIRRQRFQLPCFR